MIMMTNTNRIPKAFQLIARDAETGAIKGEDVETDGATAVRRARRAEKADPTRIVDIIPIW